MILIRPATANCEILSETRFVTSQYFSLRRTGEKGAFIQGDALPGEGTVHVRLRSIAVGYGFIFRSTAMF